MSIHMKPIRRKKTPKEASKLVFGKEVRIT